MSAPSAKPLFRATKPKRHVDDRQDDAGNDWPDQRAPQAVRDPLDYDPTPASATLSFLHAEMEHIRRHGSHVWEPAAGGGHMVKALLSAGLFVTSTDIVYRGFSLDAQKSFYEYGLAQAPIIITNPPYSEINARDGHGRWLAHALSLGVPYVAFLLNADWPAARINGMDALLDKHPPSIELLCCWKIDFRGGGSPPQRNSWFVWDINRPAPGPSTWVRKRLYKAEAIGQSEMRI